jgi:hypothetical protein
VPRFSVSAAQTQTASCLPVDLYVAQAVAWRAYEAIWRKINDVIEAAGCRSVEQGE